MESINRSIFVPDWLTLVLMISFLLLVFLKALNFQKFFGILSSIGNKGFLEAESEEKLSAFTMFNIGFTLFSLTVISSVLYFSLNHIQNKPIQIESFYKMTLMILVYMVGRFLLEFFVIRLFSLKNYVSIFFLSKRIYLFAISSGMWVLMLFYAYGNQNIMFLWIGCIVLFLSRLTAIVITNKNLIFNHLFYFILYLCAFEIAPLLILYKLITL